MNERDIEIIDIVFQNEEGLTMTEMVKKTSLSQTTVHRTLHKLHFLRVLSRSGDRYMLGPVVIRWMNSECQSQRYIEPIRPLLVDLSAEIKETVHLVQRVGNTAYYIDKVEGSGPIALKSKVGNRLNLFQTGAGRAILMLFDESELDAYFQAEKLVATTEHTETDPERLREEIGRFKKQGYAVEVEQNEKNIQCIGVPFQLGSVYLAISVTATLLETREKLESFSKNVMETVKKIEEDFGSPLGGR